MIKKSIYYVIAFIAVGYVTAFIFNHVNPWAAAAFILGASIYVADKLDKYFNNHK